MNPIGNKIFSCEWGFTFSPKKSVFTGSVQVTSFSLCTLYAPNLAHSKEEKNLHFLGHLTLLTLFPLAFEPLSFDTPMGFFSLELMRLLLRLDAAPFWLSFGFCRRVETVLLGMPFCFLVFLKTFITCGGVLNSTSSSLSSISSTAGVSCRGAVRSPLGSFTWRKNNNKDKK